MARELSCGIAFTRGMLLLLNIIFLLIGLAIIGIGIYIKVDTHFNDILTKLSHVSDFKSQSLGFLAFVLIGGGVFAVLISLFGCIGTLRHNRCLLYTYAVILIILVIIELTGFITAIVFKDKLESVYKDGLTQVFTTALDNNDTAVINAFHDLENSLTCCGVNGIQDYITHNVKPPTLCFENPVKGCPKTIIDLLEKNLPIVAGSAAVLILFELLGLIFAFVLARALKNADGEIYSSDPGAVLKAVVPGRRGNYRNI